MSTDTKYCNVHKAYYVGTCPYCAEITHDPVSRPAGYVQGDVECVDALRACLTEDEFRGACKSQAMQYAWRERFKGGDQDLKKAVWWLRMAVGDDPRRDR